jgi:hypothetical protein
MIDRAVMDRREGRLAAMNDHGTTRRQFFRGTGLAAGSLTGLGIDLNPAAAAVPRLKIMGARGRRHLHL